MNNKNYLADERLLDQFNLNDQTKTKLLKYIDMIIDYKNKLSLVGSLNRTQIIDNLLIPSIISTQLLSINNKILMDIGTGSGILGITIKLVINNVKLILCDKNIKKIAFLSDVIIKLDINNVDIMPNSLEKLDKNSLQNVDQLLIRGIKLVDIYQVLLDKFPRGTPIIYFGSNEDISPLNVQVVNSIPLRETENSPRIFIYSLALA